jgi:hypothetical protein
MNRKPYFFIALLAILFSFTNHNSLAAEDWDKRVYLATYPKSGNHWMRYLIEEATRISTSSVYRDMDTGRPHLKIPFTWGYSPGHGFKGNCRYPRKNDIYVMKTHFPAMKPSKHFDNLPYIKVIRIIRHPVDSLHSFYSLSGDPAIRKPKAKIKDFVQTFRKFQEYWDKQPNVVTIRYEDLYNSPHAQLSKVLKAAGYVVREQDVERAVANHPPQGGTMKYLQHYHSKDLMQISDELSDIMEKYHYTIPDSFLIKKTDG